MERPLSEKDLEAQARDWLALCGWCCLPKWRYPWGVGAPDIVAVRGDNGRATALLIELKAARLGTKLRASQERQEALLLAAGCKLWVCHTLEEVVAAEKEARGSTVIMSGKSPDPLLPAQVV